MTTHSQFEARVAARKEELAQQPPAKKGLRRVVAIGAGVLALALILGAVLFMAPVFTVRNVNVEGNKIATVKDITDAAEIVEGENLLRLDTAAAANKVASVPWVQTVTVDRSLPTSVDIKITEREVVAFVKSAEGDRLIDSNGHEFVIAKPPTGAVEITNIDSRDLEKAAIQRSSAVEILSHVNDRIRAKLVAIDASSQHNYVLKFRDGRTVTWGANENNEAKAISLETVVKLRGKDWNITNPELVTKK